MLGGTLNKKQKYSLIVRGKKRLRAPDLKNRPVGYESDEAREWVVRQLQPSRLVRLVRHMTTMLVRVASNFGLNLEENQTQLSLRGPVIFRILGYSGNYFKKSI